MHVFQNVVVFYSNGLTTCTHSIRGSLTAMFPDKLTTHAGVSGVASSRAITASTPILLA